MRTSEIPQFSVLFVDSLRGLMDRWGTNTNKTSSQRVAWPQSSLPYSWLQRDHARAIRCLEADGGTGRPVLNHRSPGWVKGALESMPTCYFSFDDAISIARFFGLRSDETTLLLVKLDWETWHRTEHSLCSVAERRTVPVKLARRFQPDTERIRASFDGIHSYTTVSFQALVDEIRTSFLYLEALDSPRTQAFLAQRAERSLLAQGASEDLQEAFWFERMRLLEAFRLLESALFLCQKERVRAANVEARWMGIFGEAHAEREAARLEAVRLEKAVDAIHAEMIETLEQLGAFLDTEREHHERELRRIRRLSRIRLMPLPIGGGLERSPEEQAAARARSGEIERELKLLLHIDGLKRHPKWPELTTAQREYMKGLWHQFMEIREEEKGALPGLVAYTERGLDHLEGILREATATLKEAGLDLPRELRIEGETLTEQIEWVRQERLRVQRYIGEADDELACLQDDQWIGRMESELDHIDQHPLIEEQIRKEAARHTNEIESLKKELNDLLGAKTGWLRDQ